MSLFDVQTSLLKCTRMAAVRREERTFPCGVVQPKKHTEGSLSEALGTSPGQVLGGEPPCALDTQGQPLGERSGSSSIRREDAVSHLALPVCAPRALLPGLFSPGAVTFIYLLMLKPTCSVAPQGHKESAALHFPHLICPSQRPLPSSPTSPILP